MINYLRKRGIKNPERTKLLIRRSIGFYGLDLRGLVVFTEAASGNFVFTAVIAAMAGAKKVYAVTGDSKYGSKETIRDLTYAYAKFSAAGERIEVLFNKDPRALKEADIVTNTGFVRPIDRSFIGMLKETAVIPLMCESWEYRQADIDLPYCKKRNIPVMGVKEDYYGYDIFSFCGPLCVKMLFGLEIEIYKSKIAILSNDKFGVTIERYLRKCGADAKTFSGLKNKACRDFLKGADALVAADYTSSKLWIGESGELSACDLKKLSRGISVLRFCGIVDTGDLKKNDITYYPVKDFVAHRMALTLADLGPKPAIDLHCAGLKVGQAMARARIEGLSGVEFRKRVLKESPAMVLKLNRK